MSIFGIHLIISVWDGPCIEACAIEDGPTDTGWGAAVDTGASLELALTYESRW